jgi:nitrate reductase cytochrome c-type subunit
MIAVGMTAALVLAAAERQPAGSGTVAGMLVPGTAPAAKPATDEVPEQRLLTSPVPTVIPSSRANPIAVADKFASRVRSMEKRAELRAFEGAPPVVPHPTGDLNVETCRACHALGLRAGDKVARMAPHTYLVNCNQCHVEAPPPPSVAWGDSEPMPGGAASPSGNSFEPLRPSGYGGTRAYSGAPPVIPHTTFMRTNCVSCHGEFGYDGWRPDHLDRSSCTQCHAPAAEFEQLSPTFNTPDVPDGWLPPGK